MPGSPSQVLQALQKSLLKATVLGLPTKTTRHGSFKSSKNNDRTRATLKGRPNEPNPLYAKSLPTVVGLVRSAFRVLSLPDRQLPQFVFERRLKTFKSWMGLGIEYQFDDVDVSPQRKEKEDLATSLAGVERLGLFRSIVEYRLNSREDGEKILQCWESKPTGWPQQGEEEAQNSIVDMALARCRGKTPDHQILSAVGAVLVRLQKFGLHPGEGLLMTGMIYSARCLSASALTRYLEDFHDSGYVMEQKQFNYLVETLQGSLQRLIWENANADTSALSKVITHHAKAFIVDGNASGESKPGPKPVTIESHLETYNQRTIIKYVQLLERLGEDEAIMHLMRMAGCSGPESTNREPRFVMQACFWSLYRSAGPYKTLQAIEEISKVIKTHRHISSDLWFELVESTGEIPSLPVEASETFDQTLLEFYVKKLQRIEAELSVQWVGGEEGYHKVIDNDDATAASHTPIVGKMDPNTMPVLKGASKDSHLLLSTIRDTNPLSWPSLSALADLLAENDGSVIPLKSLKLRSTTKFLFALQVELAPIDIIGVTEKMPAPAAPPPGLLRIYETCRDGPHRTKRAWYMMQLGRLLIRTKGSSKGWEATEYIVGLDRVNRSISFLYVGQSWSQQGQKWAINQGIMEVEPKYYLPFAYGPLVPRDKENAKNVAPWERSKGDHDYLREGRYWVDVDPGFSLGP